MYLMLVLGFFLFFGIHLLSVLQDKRIELVSKYGEKGFKLRYLSIALTGYLLMLVPFFFSNERSTPLLQNIYSFMNEIMFCALILLTASNMPKSLTKKIFKHPMVLGYAVWSLAHSLVTTNEYGRFFFIAQWIFAFSYYFMLIIRDRNVKIEWNIRNTIPNLFATIFMYYIIGFLHQYFTGKNIWRLIW